MTITMVALITDKVQNTAIRNRLFFVSEESEIRIFLNLKLYLMDLGPVVYLIFQPSEWWRDQTV